MFQNISNIIPVDNRSLAENASGQIVSYITNVLTKGGENRTENL